VMEDGSGAYNLCSLETGPSGFIHVGPFTCLNSTNVIADGRIMIGAHCLFAWGTVVTDTVIPAAGDLPFRQARMRESSPRAGGQLRPRGRIAPLRIEDNVWVGFDSVIMGGVKIGRGAIIGCKTVISEDIPPYAIVVGNPPRIVRFAEADDDEASRCAALEEFGLLTVENAIR